MNVLLTEIVWDAPPVVARSLPQNVLMLDCPNLDSDTPLLNRFLKHRFGFSTKGSIGCVAENHLRRKAQHRLTVTVTIWEDTP